MATFEKNSVSALSKAQNLEALILFGDDTKKILSKITDRSLAEAIRTPLTMDFKGRYRECLLVYTEEKPAIKTTKRIILVGTGKSAKLTNHHWRTLASTAVHYLKNLGITKNIGLLLPSPKGQKTSEIAMASAQGQSLGQIGFDLFKTERKEEEKARFETIRFQFLVSDAKELRGAQDGVARGSLIGEDVNWARRLILLPGGDLYPDVLVQKVQEMVAKSPAKTKIRAEYWTEKELRKHSFGGLLGVGQGSTHRPRFIILEYFQGKRGEPPIVLVGKGITFDSGGLSLKPPASQETMKYDMAGSASVLSAFKIITDLGIKCNVVALVPTAENMPSGTAIRPGDVLRMASGKTVEVLNTDAEGRLILADGLHYATTHYKPKAVIDVATLTGACALAVGEAAAGVFTNNKKLLSALMTTSEKVQENLWPLPDFDDYYVPLLKSEIADLKNIGTREAGASTASIFLRNFISNNTPWAHLDIAGCGWYDAGRDFIASKGPSGIPIRLLAQFIEDFNQQSFS